MDKIIRTLICNGNVQATVLLTTQLVNKAIAIHNTDANQSNILGGLLTCGAYVASGLKDENGAVSLTVKAKDGDGAVSVSADAYLHVRGYADGSCKQTLKGGNLTVVREDGYLRPFVGTCELDGDEPCEALAQYYQQSEQIPTAVSVIVDLDDDGTAKKAGGLIMQLLPDADDEETALAEERFAAYLQDKDNLSGDADEIFEKFIKDIACGEKVELFPEYKCNCSEEKIKGVLASVGREELLNICKEQGEVKVHCHYCNKDYVYDKKRIEETFTK